MLKHLDFISLQNELGKLRAYDVKIITVNNVNSTRGRRISLTRNLI